MLTGFLILLPFLFSLLLFTVRREKIARGIALAGALAEFVLAVVAWIQYTTGCHCLLLMNPGWVPVMGISLKFGMDGMSLLLVMLTAFLVPVIVLSSWKQHYSRPATFYGMILLMEMALVGVFTAFDGMMFYIFWELALVPAWFICAMWGGKDRIRITLKFFLYTFTGSLFMLVALIWLYYRTPLPHSFDYRAIYAAVLTPAEQVWVMLAFFLAFAIKIPIFPFHTWQPDTYTDAPPQGSMLLAGIMLKMGIYGIIRWMIPVTPLALQEYGFILIILAVTGIVYASLIAIRQDDLKRVVAWSSIAHVGLIAAGALTMLPRATDGAVIQMVSHGINIVGLFAVIAFIEQRTGTRQIMNMGGMARRTPVLAAFFMIILLGSIALPLTNGFIGEFLLLLGLFEYNWLFSAIAGLTVIFSAVYMLWIYQRTMYGEEMQIPGDVKDLSLSEILTLAPLVVMIFWIGLFPETLMFVMR